MTRALHRPGPIERPANPFIEAAFEELAMRPNEHAYDYDPFPYNIGAEVYPMWGAPGPHGQDCWGALSAPSAGPMHTSRGWHDRR